MQGRDRNMILETRNFGEIMIEEDKILTFNEGIPGFDDLTKYIIIHSPDESMPFQWLQSIEEGELAFVIINPFTFKTDYDFKIPEHIVKKLDIKSPKDINVFNIVNIPEDINKMTANLQAPIIINRKNNRAKQVILDNPEYRTKHYIIDEIKTAFQPKDNKKETVTEEAR